MICCRPWSAESGIENFISIGYLVAEILNVKVQEINNFGNNFLFIFFIFSKSSYQYDGLLYMYEIENKSSW